MNEIARFTTPLLWFKPSSVEPSEINKIFLVLSQDGNEILRKDITQAQISEGYFVWVFSQEDTSLFDSRKVAVAKIDFLSGSKTVCYQRECNKRGHLNGYIRQCSCNGWRGDLP